MCSLGGVQGPKRRSLRALGLVIPALGLAVAAGCFGGEHAAPEPPSPVALVTDACDKDLDDLDGETAAALEPVAAKEEEVAARREDLQPSLDKVKAALARVKAAAKPLREFGKAHPETYLPQALYDQWVGLRDAYQSAFDTYRERLRSARPFTRRLRATAREARALWKDEIQVVKSYDRTLEGCLGPRPLLARAEAGRIKQLEAFLSDVSADVAGRPVTLHCETASEWRATEDASKVEGHLLGYVFEGGRAVHLAPSLCYALHRLRYLHPHPDLSCLERSVDAKEPLCSPRASELIRSAVTLAHEAYHVGGELNEKRAQCWGLQGAAHVAQRLGIAPSVSDQMAWYAWKFSEAPKSYDSPECREGGKLDLDPDSPTFP